MFQFIVYVGIRLRTVANPTDAFLIGILICVRVIELFALLRRNRYHIFALKRDRIRLLVEERLRRVERNSLAVFHEFIVAHRCFLIFPDAVIAHTVQIIDLNAGAYRTVLLQHFSVPTIHIFNIREIARITQYFYAFPIGKRV